MEGLARPGDERKYDYGGSLQGKKNKKGKGKSAKDSGKRMVTVRTKLP